jgi:hypothetical protein
MSAMRSWQRVLVIGAWVSLVGAAASVLTPGVPHPAVPTAIAICAVTALGIGGSIVASAIVARIVATQVVGIDISEAVEALRGASTLTRSNQVLNIWLDIEGDEVRATAEHRFDLMGSSRYPRRLPLRLYTDVARWGSGGGFFSLIEPDGTQLQGEALADHVRKTNGGAQFEKAYTFRRGVPATFVIHTFGSFRRSDRLIWTVEHISSDFSIRILDRRGVATGRVSVKVNHHRAGEIMANMQPRETPEGPLLEFTCLGEVLPYQGFELQWTEPSGVKPDVAGAG